MTEDWTGKVVRPTRLNPHDFSPSMTFEVTHQYGEDTIRIKGEKRTFKKSSFTLCNPECFSSDQKIDSRIMLPDGRTIRTPHERKIDNQLAMNMMTNDQPVKLKPRPGRHLLLEEAIKVQGSVKALAKRMEMSYASIYGWQRSGYVPDKHMATLRMAAWTENPVVPIFVNKSSLPVAIVDSSTLTLNLKFKTMKELLSFADSIT